VAKKRKQVKKPSPPLRTSQGTWARGNIKKAHSFTEHLSKVFQPHASRNEPKEEALIQLLETPTNLNHQLAISAELTFKVINSLNPKKSSG
jgi:hypothetical protein